MRTFTVRYPLAFSLLLILALFGLWLICRAVLPMPVVSSVGDIPPEALEQPSKAQQAFAAIGNP